jgi:hypothetical protein
MHGSLLLPSSVDALWAKGNETNSIHSTDAHVPLADYARILTPYRYRAPSTSVTRPRRSTRIFAPGHTPLGAGAANSKFDQYGIERDIIRLRHGFIDLLDLIDGGQIKLSAPRRMPVVAHNRLTLELPGAEANSRLIVQP